MEGRGVLMVFLVFGALIGQSTAAFETCIFGCFAMCVVSPTNTFVCAGKCLIDCINPVPPTTDLPSFKDTQHFCKLGCAISLCANITSKENPGEQKVGSCVDSCSETCAEKN